MLENIIKSKIDNNNYIKFLLNLSLKYNLISKEIYDNIYYNLFSIIWSNRSIYTIQIYGYLLFIVADKCEKG